VVATELLRGFSEGGEDARALFPQMRGGDLRTTLILQSLGPRGSVRCAVSQLSDMKNSPYQRPPLALATFLLAATACAPACTPPEAQTPSHLQTKSDSKSDAEVLGRDNQGSQPIGDMLMEAKGVNLSKLSEAQRTSFFQLLNTQPSACGKAHSMATSLKDDAGCRDSLIAGQFMADRLAVGAMPRDIKIELEFVIESLQPQEINIKGRPMVGNQRAPVTIVVFADFECPHCRQEAPKLRALVQQYRGQVNLVYRHFPLQLHARARAAAIATVAAHAQGKFWEMHDLVFEHQSQLEDEDLYGYAKKIPGLDFDAFKLHYDAKKGDVLVMEDRADGEKLKITGTPAVFINGRKMNEFLFDGQIEGWIDDALRR